MLQDELKEIRTQLRLAMNGVISTSMREKGIVYKLNFGVLCLRSSRLPLRINRIPSWLPPCGKKIFVSSRYWLLSCNRWAGSRRARRSNG